MNVKIYGVIRNIFPTETVGANNFKKRLLWVEEVEQQYPQFYPIEFTKDNTEVLNNYKPGDIVEVDANVNGRFYKKPADGKEMVFVTIAGWKIKKLEEGAVRVEPSTRQQTGGIGENSGTGSFAPNAPGEDDDLPF